MIDRKERHVMKWADKKEGRKETVHDRTDNRQDNTQVKVSFGVSAAGFGT